MDFIASLMSLPSCCDVVFCKRSSSVIFTFSNFVELYHFLTNTTLPAIPYTYSRITDGFAVLELSLPSYLKCLCRNSSNAKLFFYEK